MCALQLHSQQADEAIMHASNCSGSSSITRTSNSALSSLQEHTGEAADAQAWQALQQQKHY
jgi:hypothetical protein